MVLGAAESAVGNEKAAVPLLAVTLICPYHEHAGYLSQTSFMDMEWDSGTKRDGHSLLITSDMYLFGRNKAFFVLIYFIIFCSTYS